MSVNVPKRLQNEENRTKLPFKKYERERKTENKHAKGATRRCRR